MFSNTPLPEDACLPQMSVRSRGSLCVAVLAGFAVVAGLVRISTVSPAQPETSAARPLPACSISPLTPIGDVGALAFEERVGSAGMVDVASLSPTTLRALRRFERTIRSIGGAIAVKSGYRPKAYQAHLREVWDKWMGELRNNREAQCEALRAEVQQEFARHGLLESQRPVPVSDHTLGIGFDAAVSVPAGARFHRRRVTVDLLARLSGIRRPDVFHDPVHFRLIGRRTSRG